MDKGLKLCGQGIKPNWGDGQGPKPDGQGLKLGGQGDLSWLDRDISHIGVMVSR